MICDLDTLLLLGLKEALEAVELIEQHDNRLGPESALGTVEVIEQWYDEDDNTLCMDLGLSDKWCFAMTMGGMQN